LKEILSLAAIKCANLRSRNSRDARAQPVYDRHKTIDGEPAEVGISDARENSRRPIPEMPAELKQIVEEMK